MYLPRMKYKSDKHISQIVQFGGIHYGRGGADGEFAETENLSSMQFPALSQRKSRKQVELYSAATDLFGWDKLVVVADGKLYLENEEICKVSDAPKQFAVVNSKLIVWPDKLQIDLTNNEILSMDSEFYQDPSPLFTSNSIQISSLPMVEREYKMKGYRVPSSGDAVPWINYFGYDAEKIFWDAETGWTSDGKTPLAAELVSPINGTSAGAIIIPKITAKGDGSYTYAVPAEAWNYNKPSAPLSRAEENQMGIFGILTDQKSYGYGEPVDCSADFYQASAYGTAKKIELQPGDRVEIAGSLVQANNQKAIRIAGILKGTAPDYVDTLQFENEPFLVPTEYATLTREYPAAEKLVTDVVDHENSSHRYFCTITLPRAALAGEQLLVFEKSFTWNGASFEVAEDSKEFYLYDRANKTLVALASGSIADDDFDLWDISFRAYSRETEEFRIVLPIPELDYICEKDNRLWGVSNKADNEVYDPETGEYRHYTSRVLYASALGLPYRFFDFDGTAADSFQVAVASEGDFTGCIGYGSNVLFFKEDMLYKMLGTSPLDYQLYSYRVSGVQPGCHKSMVILDEVLYYKGTGGVYRYTGSVPALISENFGPRQYDGAAAGTDGRQYYISMRDAQTETYGLYVYNPGNGIWLREDETHAAAFARYAEQLYFVSDGKLYLAGQADAEEPDLKWTALFCPFEDTAYGMRGYSKLWLKLELLPGAVVIAEISEDKRPFRQIGMWGNSLQRTVTAPIFPGRCDSFRLRLRGTGRCIVRSIVREFDVGSERN